MTGYLLPNLVLFGRVLRAAGIDASPEQTAVLAEAAERLGLRRRGDLRAAARAIFVQRRDDLELFDRLFDLFWRQAAGASGAGPELGRLLRESLRPKRRDAAVVAPARDADGRQGDETTELSAFAYSSRESLRQRDFADLTDEERAEVERLLEGMELRIELRASRRTRSDDSGLALDLRRSLRRSLRYGGEPVSLARRRRKTKPRPLVLICDVSQSMEVYSRLLLRFAWAVGRTTRRFEAFVLGTRLTRITRQLRRGDIDASLRDAAAAARDWGGGTRIGECLRTFNWQWGRRVLGQGAVVAIISDGWDRGEPELLSTEMARLRRSCRRVLWLNPLLGSPGYEPLTRGMQAALPYVDDFLTVHNLASLEQLAEALSSPAGQSAGTAGHAS